MPACRIIESYTTPYPNPLILTKGTTVTIGDRTSEYSGWLWCTHTSGVQGWVPQSYLRRDGDIGLLLRDYDAAELSVDVGERLDILAEESGWYWCCKATGETGWIPANVAELI